MKLNEDLILEWIAALRSGNYIQGERQLHIPPNEFDNTHEYCCLGVLCEVAVKHGMVRFDANYPDAYTYEFKNPNPEDTGSDMEYLVEYINSDLGHFREFVGLTPEEELTLIRMNDGPIKGDLTMDKTQRKTFNEIAEYIESAIIKGDR